MNNIKVVQLMRCVSGEYPEINSVVYQWSDDYTSDEGDIVMNSYGYIIKLSGVYGSNIDAHTISMMVASIFFDTSYSSNNEYIIDLSDLTYRGGDKFLNWYHRLSNTYVKYEIPTLSEKCIYPKKKVALVLSGLCTNAVFSLIEDEGTYELKDLCFNSQNEAIKYLIDSR